MRATFSGKDFKQLISSLTKLPSMGAFLGSELINLEVKDGICKASSFGVILSTAEIAAKGSFPLCCIDERLLIPFSALCENAKWVAIELKDKELFLHGSRGHKINYPLQDGKLKEIEIPADYTPLEITEKLAKKIEYLADIAFSDSSMPNLNCVYLTPKTVTAVNQKCVALLKIDTKLKSNLAVPIPIAKILSKDYQLYVLPKQTIAKIGSAAYTMSSPVQAQESFPFKIVLEYYKAPKTPVLSVSGKAFAQLITDCNACLSNISRVDVPLSFTTEPDGKMLLKAENGAVKFAHSITTKEVQTQSIELSIPLDEVIRALPFLEAVDTVSLQQGSKGETYLLMSDGMLMYPALAPAKKKKK